MPEAKHGNPMSLSPLGNPMAEIFAHNTDPWFATQAGLDMKHFSGVLAPRHFLDRLAHCIDAFPTAMQPSVRQRVHIGEQQEWVSGVFRRATEDIAAFKHWHLVDNEKGDH